MGKLSHTKASHRSIYFLLILFMASGCSIDLSQSTSAPANPGFATATLPPRGNNASAALPKLNIPVTWAGLNLTGRLVYISATQNGNTPSMDIRILDLANGEITILYQTPPLAWIYFAAVSPDNQKLVMAYALPPGANGSAHQELYDMPLDGSQPPQPILAPPSVEDEYFQPAWSADGKYIYFSHVNYQAPPKQGQHYPLYEIYRMAYPGGQPEKLVDQAFWPRLSPDSSQLAYVSLDPMTGKNRLFLAKPDGSQASEVSISGPNIPDVFDAPLFSPDGQTLLFSAPVPAESFEPGLPTWWEKLLGITVASAHSVLSDWWSVPLTGGTPQRLTHLKAIGLFGSVAPDKKHIASYSGGPLLVMNPDGSGLASIVSDLGGLPGTVNWIP